MIFIGLNLLNILTQGSANIFSVKGQIVNIFSFTARTQENSRRRNITSYITWRVTFLTTFLALNLRILCYLLLLFFFCNGFTELPSCTFLSFSCLGISAQDWWFLGSLSTESPTGLFSLPRCSLRVWGLPFSIVFFSLREWREVRSAERTAVYGLVSLIRLSLVSSCEGRLPSKCH